MNKSIDLEYFTVDTDPKNPSLITELLVYASSAHKMSWTKKEKILLAEYVYHKVDEMYNVYDIVSVNEDVYSFYISSANEDPVEQFRILFHVELKISNRAFNNLLFETIENSNAYQK